jgi:tetratricopeptide (TPR) repeat protein
MERAETAEHEYRQAARLDPLESLPLLALGRLQWAQGQPDAALESFRGAVERTPGWGEAHVALGNALLALAPPHGEPERLRRADGHAHL